MSLLATLLQALDDDEQEMIAIRRQLHAHPEVSFHEKQTAAYIKAYYAALDMPVVPCGDGYGMYVDIEGGQLGPKLALRADFDALAIQEDNELPFKSQNPGVMHACGHDAHTAYLLVLAKELNKIKTQLSGSTCRRSIAWWGKRHDCSWGLRGGYECHRGSCDVVNANGTHRLSYRRNPNWPGQFYRYDYRQRRPRFHAAFEQRCDCGWQLFGHGAPNHRIAANRSF